MRLTWMTALCLLTLPGCSLIPQRPPETITVREPVRCLDTAMMRCAGVPERGYGTAAALADGLGEALRALRECQDRHNELRGCVAAHNEGQDGE